MFITLFGGYGIRGHSTCQTIKGGGGGRGLKKVENPCSSIRN